MTQKLLSLSVLCLVASVAALTDCEELYSAEYCLAIGQSNQATPGTSTAFGSSSATESARVKKCVQEASNACTDMRHVIREQVLRLRSQIDAAPVPPGGGEPSLAVTVHVSPAGRAALNQLSELPELSEIAPLLRRIVGGTDLQNVTVVQTGLGAIVRAQFIQAGYGPLAIAFVVGVLTSTLACYLLFLWRGTPPLLKTESVAKPEAGSAQSPAVKSEPGSADVPSTPSHARSASTPTPTVAPATGSDDVFARLVRYGMWFGVVVVLVIFALDVVFNWYNQALEVFLRDEFHADPANAPRGCVPGVDGPSLLNQLTLGWDIVRGNPHPCLEYSKRRYGRAGGWAAALRAVNWGKGLTDSLVNLGLGWLPSVTGLVSKSFYTFWDELPWLAKWPLLTVMGGYLLLRLIFGGKSLFVKTPLFRVGLVEQGFQRPGTGTGQDHGFGVNMNGPGVTHAYPQYVIQEGAGHQGSLQHQPVLQLGYQPPSPSNTHGAQVQGQHSRTHSRSHSRSPSQSQLRQGAHALVQPRPPGPIIEEADDDDETPPMPSLERPSPILLPNSSSTTAAESKRKAQPSSASASATADDEEELPLPEPESDQGLGLSKAAAKKKRRKAKQLQSSTLGPDFVQRVNESALADG